MWDINLAGALAARDEMSKHNLARRLCVLVAFLVPGLPARGDFFTAEVYVEGSGSDQPSNSRHVIQTGPTSASAAASYSGYLNGHQTATASATARLSADSLLSASILATSDQAGGYTPFGIAQATASWFDTLRIGGAGFTGGEFLFRFEVEGVLSGATGASWTGGGYAEMNLQGPGGRAFGTGIHLDDSSDSVTPQRSPSSPYSTFPFDWESYEMTIMGDGTYSFHGTATFVQTLFADADNRIEAALSLKSSTWDAAVSADFGSTVRLTAILLGDGRTPESAGYSLTFGSGLTSPNSIPEPTSLTLAALAVLTSASFARLRRAE